MSACSPCGPALPSINGVPGGRGGGATLLFSAPTQTNITNVLTTMASYTLPANTLDADGDHLFVDLWGDALQSNAAPQTWSFGLSLNAVILWFDTSAVFAISATRRPWRMFIDIQRKTATTCSMGGFVTFSNTAALPINGTGDISTAPQGNAIGSTLADPVVAWGSSQLVDFAVQASVAAISFVLKGGYIKRETIS